MIGELFKIKYIEMKLDILFRSAHRAEETREIAKIIMWISTTSIYYPFKHYFDKELQKNCKILSNML